MKELKGKTIQLADLMKILNVMYSPELAESWDKVGLHFGHADRPIKKVMTSLDVRPNVVAEAIANQVDTLVVHHPPIFNPVNRFNLSDPQIAMYADLIKYDINVFAMHTNFDRAINGMNDWLAVSLGLEAIEPLGGFDEEDQPNMPRIGKFSQPLSRTNLLDRIKANFHVDVLKLVEKEPHDTYQTVAICGGSGDSFIMDAVKAGADVFITGDITYHTGHDAYEHDILLVDAGHYIESIFTYRMCEILNQLADSQEWQLEVVASNLTTNPFTYY